MDGSGAGTKEADVERSERHRRGAALATVICSLGLACGSAAAAPVKG
jgi:hypothetical protein